jgi:hypothetical protein
MCLPTEPGASNRELEIAILFLQNRQDSSLSVLLALQIIAMLVVGPSIEIIGGA